MNMRLQLTLNVDPDYRFFTECMFFETCDAQRLQTLLCLPPGSKTLKSQRYILKDISKESGVISNNQIPVRYEFAHKGSSQYGRVYPRGNKSLGELSLNLRTFLIGDAWMPLDFENAHPTIMHQALSQNGIPCPHLARYCNERNTILQEVMLEYHVGRADAKRLFISLFFLGSFETWARECKTKLEPLPFIADFAAEMGQNVEHIAAANQDMKSSIPPNDRALSNKLKKKRGPGRPPKKLARISAEDSTNSGNDGKATASKEQIVSAWCQELERRALRAFFDFLVDEGFINSHQPCCMLRYDGIDLPLEAWERAAGWEEDLFARAQSAIEHATGLRLRIATKPYERSPELVAAIEQEADVFARVPKDHRLELHPNALRDLRTYEAQKVYFECFIAKIMHDVKFAWIQRKRGSSSEFDTVNMLSKADLCAAFEHVPTDSETFSFIHCWVRDPNLRVCNEVKFQPYNEIVRKEPISPMVFNLFQGLPKYYRAAVVQDSERDALLAPFHYIGLQLCEGDPLKYQLLFEYVAQMVQYPDQRPHLSIVFQDKPQGVGSDTWFNVVGRVVGQMHYNNSSNMGDFLGNHAEGLMNRLLVVVNELEIKESSANQSRIKDIITCERLTVNPKHVRPFEISIFARIVFFSNRANAIHFDNEDNERRFVVWKPTRACLDFSAALWDYLHKKLFSSPKFLNALFEALMEVPCLAEWNPKRLRDLTFSQAYMDSSVKNAPLHAKFFARYCLDLAKAEFGTLDERGWNIFGENNEAITVLAADLHNRFKGFVELTTGNGGREGTFNRELILNKYGHVIQCIKSGERQYRFSPRALWAFLVKKNWVPESFKFYMEQHQNEIDTARETLVHPGFQALAKRLPQSFLDELPTTL